MLLLALAPLSGHAAVVAQQHHLLPQEEVELNSVLTELLINHL